MRRSLLGLVLLLSAAGHCGTVVETEVVKPLKPTGSLGTCAYRATPAEQSFFQKLEKSETVTGSILQSYSIRGKKDKYVSWFAIVRGYSRVEGADNQVRILLEQKYFDGMTDCHIMLVSAQGSGDFLAAMEIEGKQTIPMLSLVRVYGKVVEESSGVPRVQAEYARVWPWGAFTLTDLGPEDHGNPKWRQLCKVCKSGRVYNPYPSNDYYLNALGDPKDFGIQPQPAK
jgi:hypothetical protein